MKEQAIPTSVTTVTSECNNNVTHEIEELRKENERLKKELANRPKEVSTSSSNNDLLDHLALMYVYVEKKNEFMNKVVKSYYDKFS